MDFFFFNFFKMTGIDLFCHIPGSVSTKAPGAVQEVQLEIELSASFNVKFPEL